MESLQPYPIANTLTARMHKGLNSTLDERQTPVVTHSLRGEGFDASEDGTGRGTPLVPVAVDTYNGTITGENLIDNTLTAKVDNKSVWFRVDEIETGVARTIVQVRTRAGGTDILLAAELDKQIAVKLTQTR